MVNRPLPCRKIAQGNIRRRSELPPRKGGSVATSSQTKSDEFSQTLGKQIFRGLRFELSENLRLILLDYAQKRSDAANIAFKATC
jgi:hypothetical protein